jgi:hypothetical protein
LDHVTAHLISNKVFGNEQFGFLKGKSTVLQLLKVMDMWTDSLESGGQIDVIYTDLERAFYNSHSHIFVNAPYFDALRVGSEERMIFLGGHPAKY